MRLFDVEGVARARTFDDSAFGDPAAMPFRQAKASLYRGAVCRLLSSDGRHHVLVVADPATEWELFVPFLEDSEVLVLYPSPYVGARDLSQTPRMVMVQPIVWQAEHLVDIWERFQGGCDAGRRA